MKKKKDETKLLVWLKVDGLALGAAAASTQTDIESKSILFNIQMLDIFISYNS